jgi:phosphate starvation-inducible PhoH-like protein
LAKKKDKMRQGRQPYQSEKPIKEFVRVEAKTDNQRRYITTIKNNQITFCKGPAGTGKTIIPVGLALQAILAPESTVKRIVVMRPVKEACGEHLGFLPGDLNEKMSPWARPVTDNMEVFIDERTVSLLLHEKKLVIVPLALARGRSLNDAWIILDEAQNVSKAQMLMALTRIGSNSRMIINGDLQQSDDPRENNGLMDAFTRLQGIEGIGFSVLEKQDIIRHPLIGAILTRYESESIVEPCKCQENMAKEAFEEDIQVPVRAEDLILRTV